MAGPGFNSQVRLDYFEVFWRKKNTFVTSDIMPKPTTYTEFKINYSLIYQSFSTILSIWKCTLRLHHTIS
jgi:hypothetical protein